MGDAVYDGVRVDDRRIQSSIENLINQGYGNDHICKVIGMPQEVVDKVRHRLKASSKK